MASFYRPRVGISACLLGEAVRWDAGHKRDAYLVDVFGAHVEWVPTRYARARADALASEDLSGYIPKKDSPNMRFPDLPVEEQGRLSEPSLGNHA